MEFDKELDELRVKVADVQASARAAASETHDQIQAAAKSFPLGGVRRLASTEHGGDRGEDVGQAEVEPDEAATACTCLPLRSGPGGPS